MAIDLPGADPKVRATTIANQPQATSAIAPAIRPTVLRGPLVVVEVLNAGTLRLEVADDIDQAIDPNLKTGPAEAGSGVKIE